MKRKIIRRRGKEYFLTKAQRHKDEDEDEDKEEALAEALRARRK